MNLKLCYYSCSLQQKIPFPDVYVYYFFYFTDPEESLVLKRHYILDRDHMRMKARNFTLLYICHCGEKSS